MSQTDLLHEPLEESLHDQPQPDPWFVDVIREVKIPEAREERDVVKPPPRADSKTAREETKSAPTPRPPRVAFNRD